MIDHPFRLVYRNIIIAQIQRYDVETDLGSGLVSCGSVHDAYLRIVCYRSSA
jgi:hypothetical protein